MRTISKNRGGRDAADRWTPSESQLRILDAIRRIPRGFVCTYGEIAAVAGLPRRARLVGQVLRVSPLADEVPWHRVVNASGRISERGGEGPRMQLRRLAAEGVEVDARGRIDLAVYLWRHRKKGGTTAIDDGRRIAVRRSRSPLSSSFVVEGTTREAPKSQKPRKSK